MNKLDWFLFGNGYGMASPYFDDCFYWLKDMSGGNRKKAKGRFYRLSNGYGVQLTSYEWFKPSPGTERILAGKRFVVFQAGRRGVRVEVSWGHKPSPKSHDDIAAIAQAVRDWGHGA
jgi:hypothetical protein